MGYQRDFMETHRNASESASTIVKPLQNISKQFGLCLGSPRSAIERVAAPYGAASEKFTGLVILMVSPTVVRCFPFDFEAIWKGFWFWTIKQFDVHRISTSKFWGSSNLNLKFSQKIDVKRQKKKHCAWHVTRVRIWGYCRFFLQILAPASDPDSHVDQLCYTPGSCAMETQSLALHDDCHQCYF